MRARRSVWTDDDVRELLRSFVTVADEVHRLQVGDDAECRLFQGFCEQGHYGGRTKPTSTRQGIYAIAPSGAFLASVNSTRPERVAAMLREALARWQDLPDDRRRLTDERRAELQSIERFADRYPADGLVLAEHVRDLGRDADPGDWRTQASNEDQAWFTRAEARSLVPEPEVGAVAAAPRKLVERLVRLHLVDSVRGQTSPFPKDAVALAELHSEVTRVDGDLVHLRLDGRTRAEQRGRWIVADRGEPVDHERGVDTAISGGAVWDRAAERFVSFELLAVGRRWGATRYNQRTDDTAATRIGFAFVLAGPDHPRVAPAYWWVYDLD